MKRLSIIILCLLACASVPSFGQRVVFIGDSVTDGGWGRSSDLGRPTAERNLTDLNHIYGHSYMMLCASHYEASQPERGLEFFNRGISGDDLARIEARWDDDVLAMRPDVLSVLVGINDTYLHVRNHAGEEFDFDGWESRYRALLDRARDENPELRIMLGTPFIARVGRNGAADNYLRCERITHRLAEIVCRVAADIGAVAVRYDEMFARLSFQYPAVPMSHWIWDGIHPTAAGHRKMADMWIAEFDRLNAFWSAGEIIFRDEFDSGSMLPDTAVWRPCTYAHNAWSQHFRYVEPYENVRIENGCLVLTARLDDGHYKNAGIRTRHGFEGNTRLMVRARLDKRVRGAFPAIWQMPVGGRPWPESGEVDVMEWVQGTPDAVYQTIHTSYNMKHSLTGDTGSTNVTRDFDVTQYHVYAADRTDDAVIFYIDGVETGRYENLHDEEEAIQFPFCLSPFDIILNYSLGGYLDGRPTWPGLIDDNDLPGEMWVDWVRVMKL